MDFKAKLDDIFRRNASHITKPTPKIYHDINDAIKEVVPVVSVLYNIHKRSLPVGLDKPMAWNFTKDQAERFLERHLKSQEVFINPDGSATVYYYDAVRADGKDSGIYHNGKPIMIERRKD